MALPLTYIEKYQLKHVGRVSVACVLDQLDIYFCRQNITNLMCE